MRASETDGGGARAGVRGRDGASRGSEREREKERASERGEGENESPRLVIVYQSVHLVSEVRHGEPRYVAAARPLIGR